MNTKQLLCRPNNNVISVITQVRAVTYWYKKNGGQKVMLPILQ